MLHINSRMAGWIKTAKEAKGLLNEDRRLGKKTGRGGKQGKQKNR